MRRLRGIRMLSALYAPALLLGVVQAAAVLQVDGSGPLTGTVEAVWELQHLYLAGCILGGLAAMVMALSRVTSVTARRQPPVGRVRRRARRGAVHLRVRRPLRPWDSHRRPDSS